MSTNHIRSLLPKSLKEKKKKKAFQDLFFTSLKRAQNIGIFLHKRNCRESKNYIFSFHQYMILSWTIRTRKTSTTQYNKGTDSNTRQFPEFTKQFRTKYLTTANQFLWQDDAASKSRGRSQTSGQKNGKREIG
jgi:hypothetical protein